MRFGSTQDAIRRVVLFALTMTTSGPIWPQPPGAIDLMEPRFRASGRGHVTTSGDIAAGSSILTVANRSTWIAEQGIRVRRAGSEAAVHDADASWVQVDPGASVFFDTADKKQGAASVACSYSGTSPAADLCEVRFAATNFRFDELRFDVKSSAPTASGDLHIALLGASGPIEHAELAIPSLPADSWRETFVSIRGETLGAVTGLRLRCNRGCSGIQVRLDDFRLARDLLTWVTRITAGAGAGAAFELETVAGRTVAGEIVYHDDTDAIGAWLREADVPGGATLYAPAGIYYVSQERSLYSGTRLSCQGRFATTFKNTGRTVTGPSTMFTIASEAAVDVLIEDCGFDSNGWNVKDFLSVLGFSTPEESHNIRIRRNAFYDSSPPGRADCDAGQNRCATLQRQYIVVLYVDGAWVEDNLLRDGGRIKLGRPGKNLHIRRNVIDFVNDNAITVVDRIKGQGCDVSPIPCLSEGIEIVDNVIRDPVGVGINFGADGETGDDPGLELRDIRISRNRIYGYFVGGITALLPSRTSGVQIDSNLVVSYRPRPLANGLFTRGISLLRGEDPVSPAADVAIVGNAVYAWGADATFNSGAIFLRGDIDRVRLSSNVVACLGCANIQRGIRFRGGRFQDPQVIGNVVYAATSALNIEATWLGGVVTQNRFLDSTNPSAGQVNVAPEAEDVVEAVISGNQILNGAGYGIRCSGAGSFALTGLSANVFSGNERDDVAGCPPGSATRP